MTYTIKNEPKEGVYRDLIRYAMLCCTQFSLVVRSSIPLDEDGSQFIQTLKPFLVRTEKTSRWPGTQLIGDFADVSHYQLSSASAELITSVSTGLFQWMQPELPEDLCLFRTPNEPWLVTIAHERDAYVNLTDDERLALEGRIPQLELQADITR